MSPFADSLLEREGTLEEIEVALETARRGSGCVLILEGPQGIGKSTLLAEARRRARRLALHPLGAAGAEAESSFPFGIALQLFDAHLRDMNESEKEPLLSGPSGLADSAFTGSADLAARYPLVHALYRLTVELAERKPLLITIDDAEWADPSSLRYLGYLSRRLEPVRVALVLTITQGFGADPEGLLGELTDSRRALRRHLTPLSSEGVQALVERRMGRCDREFAAAAFELTAGNPLLVEELARAARERGVEAVADAVPTVRKLVPERVLRATDLRIRRFASGSMDLARAVAILEPRARADHAAVLAGLDQDEAAAALDAMAATGILRSGDFLSYVQPLVRSAVRSGIPAEQRARLHARAARLVAADHDRAAAAAAHLMHARASGDAWVVDRLRVGADEAMAKGSPVLAGAFLRRALAEPPTDESRRDVLMELGRSEVVSGELDSAVGRFEEAVQLASAGPQRASGLYELGRALHLRGDQAHAAGTLDRALDELDESEAGAENELGSRVRAAWLAAARLETSLQAAAMKRVEPILGRSDRVTRTDSVVLAGVAHQLVLAAEPRDRALSLTRRALADGLLESEEADRPGSISAVETLTCACQLEEAYRCADRLVQDARSRGSVPGVAAASLARSYPAHLMGWLRDAEADARAAIDAGRRGGGQHAQAAHAQLALVLLERGDLDGALEAAELALSDEQGRHSPMRAQALDARARIRIARSSYHGALEDAFEAGRIANDALIFNPAVIGWRSQAALGCAALGRQREANLLAREELRLARRFGAPRTIGVALRVAGLVQRGNRSLRLLQWAAEILATSLAELEHARALAVLGAAQRRHGTRAAARDTLRRALDMAHRFGGAHIAGFAREQLRLAGARPRRDALRGVDALTASESKVAELAASGMTNREIAESLVITTKAVEWHLRHVYQKLDVHSRKQLPDELRLAETA
jgi:DNA-binding CsgD family transcriptional regulator/Tfp pilus assembly protein PilF